LITITSSSVIVIPSATFLLFIAILISGSSTTVILSSLPSFGKKYPDDKDAFTELIKSKGLYDELSSLNYFKLNPKILKGEIDPEIIEQTKKEEDYRISISKK